LQKTPLSSAKKAALPLPSAEREAGTAMEVTESTPAKSQNGLFSSPAAAIPPTEAEEEKKDTTTEPPATKLDLFSNAKPISHGLSAFLIKVTTSSLSLTSLSNRLIDCYLDSDPRKNPRTSRTRRPRLPRAVQSLAIAISLAQLNKAVLVAVAWDRRPPPQ
jgi:hypothetical protein